MEQELMLLPLLIRGDVQAAAAKLLVSTRFQVVQFPEAILFARANPHNGVQALTSALTYGALEQPQNVSA